MPHDHPSHVTRLGDDGETDADSWVLAETMYDSTPKIRRPPDEGHACEQRQQQRASRCWNDDCATTS